MSALRELAFDECGRHEMKTKKVEIEVYVAGIPEPTLVQAVAALPPRLKSILKLLALSQTREEIAQHLKISRKTVEYHALVLAGRLGIVASDYAAMARIAIKTGLIEP